MTKAPAEEWWAAIGTTCAAPARSTAATPQAEASLGPATAPLRGTLTDCLGYSVCVSGHYSLTSLPRPACRLRAPPAAKASQVPERPGRTVPQPVLQQGGQQGQAGSQESERNEFGKPGGSRCSKPFPYSFVSCA